MKAIFTAGCLLLASLATPSLYAQNIQEANIRFAKVDRPGLIADFPFTKEVVEPALRSRLEKAGFNKPKSERGFSFYRGANWAEISPALVDVYTRVDGKGDKSSIVLLVSKGYDNYVSAASDPVMSANLKAFLQTLLPDIQAEKVRSDIGWQEGILREAEKAYKNADEEGNRLSRERERLDKQIAESAAEKSRRGDALNAEKAKLEALKALIK
jgi:hypothetical protein